jgi:2',3'-cyclic-nucleotide 2'-phosphodiesterase (5'-nucleotidase family)
LYVSRETLESCFSKYPAHEGRFPQVSGVWVDWNPHGPAGNRVLSVSVGPQRASAQPLELEKIYVIGSVDYLMKGGDGCTGFTKHGR